MSISSTVGIAERVTQISNILCLNWAVGKYFFSYLLCTKERLLENIVILFNELWKFFMLTYCNAFHLPIYTSKEMLTMF